MKNGGDTLFQERQQHTIPRAFAEQSIRWQTVKSLLGYGESLMCVNYFGPNIKTFYKKNYYIHRFYSFYEN